MYEYLKIKHYDIPDEIQYKTLYENLNSLMDYISLDRYRNVKILINALKYVDIETLIKLKNKYGYNYIELINDNSFKYFLSNYPSKYMIKNSKLINIVANLYSKYNNANMFKHIDAFIVKLGNNINKLTINNVDDLFNLYVLVCTKKFDGFKRWGPGNHKSSDRNLLNHYKKHVINNKNENWSNYISDITLEQYGRFAIDISKHMKNKIIHTNGTNVYLSGTRDKVLVIGRLDKDNNLGISSCYIISDTNYDKKINAFKNNACLYLC